MKRPTLEDKDDESDNKKMIMKMKNQVEEEE